MPKADSAWRQRTSHCQGPLGTPFDHSKENALPKYTVIMPAKDAEKTIYAAIKSVFVAFPKDIEVVVWDDGSTDTTAHVANAYGDKRVRVIQSKTSVGSGVGRQKVIDATDSEYLVNQDSDDISLPWRHAVQAPHMRNSDFSFTSVHRFAGKNLLRQPTLPLNYSQYDSPLALLFHNPFSHSTMLAKRSALVEIGGYSTSRVAQDYEMLLRAAAYGKNIRRSGIPSLLYRLSPNQISRQEDYVTRILASPRIIESYALLVDNLLPNCRSTHTTPSSIQQLQNSINRDQIFSLIRQFSPHLRLYYQQLHTFKRYGQVSAAVLN